MAHFCSFTVKIVFMQRIGCLRNLARHLNQSNMAPMVLPIKLQIEKNYYWYCRSLEISIYLYMECQKWTKMIPIRISTAGFKGTKKMALHMKYKLEFIYNQ